MSLSTARSRCPVCGCEDGILVSEFDRYRKPLRTVACPACGLYRNDPLPTGEELQAFHEEEYRQSYQGSREPKAKRSVRAKRLAEARLQVLQQYVSPGQRVLDAGSGSGEFVAALASRGYDAEGLEADPVYGEFARRQYGVRIQSAGLLEAEYPAESFAAISLFHVLEHQPDPVAVLQRLRRWLRRDGVLLVEVPNLGSRHQHPAKRFHFAHVIGFTPESLKRTVQQAGFRERKAWQSWADRNLHCLLVPNDGSAPGAQPAVSRERIPEPLVTTPGAIARYYLHPMTYLRFVARTRQFASELLAVARRR